MQKERQETYGVHKITQKQIRKKQKQFIFKKIITKNIPKLMKDIKPHIQEMQQTSCRINTDKT